MDGWMDGWMDQSVRLAYLAYGGVVHIGDDPYPGEQLDEWVGDGEASGVDEDVGGEAQQTLRRHRHRPQRLRQHRQHRIPGSHV